MSVGYSKAVADACACFDIIMAADGRTMTGSRGDAVFIRCLTASAKVGLDAWGRPDRVQPVLIDIRLPTHLKSTGNRDSLEGGIDYGKVSKIILQMVNPDAKFSDLNNVCHSVFEGLFGLGSVVDPEITVTLPSGALMTDGVGVHQNYGDQVTDFFFVRRLRVACIVGLNTHERLSKQELLVDLKIAPSLGCLQKDYQTLVSRISEVMAIPDSFAIYQFKLNP